MDDVLGYEGKHAVVTGAASGMGEQVARILHELGARVTALDVKPVSTPVSAEVRIDLGDRAAIDDAVGTIDGDVDALFSCAGLPGPPFTDVQVMTVNFVGPRHLVGRLLDRMPRGAAIGCIASGAGMGWQQMQEQFAGLHATATFEDAVAWLEANPEAMPWGGYMASKVVLNQWVAATGCDLMRDRGIRLNCINPGPTDTPMMPSFHAMAGKEVIDAATGPIDRYSTPEEQAWPLVCLNSPRLSYVCAEALWTDGGFLAAVTTGRHAGFAVPEDADA